MRRQNGVSAEERGCWPATKKMEAKVGCMNNLFAESRVQ